GWFDQSSKGNHAFAYNGRVTLATSGVVARESGVPQVIFGGMATAARGFLLAPFNLFQSPHTIVCSSRLEATGRNALFSGLLNTSSISYGQSAGSPMLILSSTSNASGGTAVPMQRSAITSWKAEAAFAG